MELLFGNLLLVRWIRQRERDRGGEDAKRRVFYLFVCFYVLYTMLLLKKVYNLKEDIQHSDINY